MQSAPSQTAERFWRTRVEYPAYDHTQLRRWYDLQHVWPRVKHCETIVDIGGGDGTLLRLLNELTEASEFWLYDISEGLLSEAQKHWNYDLANLTTRCGDMFAGRSKFQYAEWTLCMGLLCYCFDDKSLLSFMRRIRSPNVIVRVPCAGYKRIVINKKSKALESEYAAVYRTLGEYHSLLSVHHNIESVQRIWPDEIESRFGTHQWVFDLSRKD